ncbi:RES family NAD+ phosphorylase [Burkholderia sp. JKS000303]|uniref:RES family NAD+ phosphorylase n=1 Tax=Burkholderia sp. JKS000303 TaxID=1938747 RepID=UPI000BF62836|nr:RES family NAD+ phosphorylase [Burkholderia sp. JKS000303]PFH19466.1 RES domain-containing protein [Burkholderia sp. JKS000303]
MRWHSVSGPDDTYVTLSLPDDWADLTCDRESTTELGRQWLEAGQQRVMRVPSVVCPTDGNLPLDPTHPDMSAVKVVRTEPFTLDPRLFGHAAR